MNDDFFAPHFGIVPEEYDARFLEGLIRQLAGVLEDMKASGSLHTSALNISSLPISAAGLRAGDVWNNGGVLTVVTAVSRTKVTGISATSAVGDEAVLTP